MVDSVQLVSGPTELTPAEDRWGVLVEMVRGDESIRRTVEVNGLAFHDAGLQDRQTDAHLWLALADLVARLVTHEREHLDDVPDPIVANAAMLRQVGLR